VSQTSFSFAVSPSQKPLFIQSVYLALTVRHLITSWESKVINTSTYHESQSIEQQTQARLMASLTNQDETQLLTSILSALQEILSFMQNLQEGIDVDRPNMCEIK